MHNEEIRNEIRHRTSSRSEVELRQLQPGLQESAGSTNQVENAACRSTSVEVLTPTDKPEPAPKVTVTDIYYIIHYIFTYHQSAGGSLAKDH